MQTRKNSFGTLRWLLLVCGVAVPHAPALASNPPSHPIYRFTAPNDGSLPNGGLTRDSQGRLYGVTKYGGSTGNGTVYRLTRQSPGPWTEEILYNFAQSGGYWPIGPLTLDTSGNVYGTTQQGGAANAGTVFKLSSSASGWTLTTLHAFGSPGDGAVPPSGVIFGPDGNLFGVTESGGATHLGTVFEVSPNGDNVFYAKIHDFLSQPDGLVPISQLVVRNGYLIGTTGAGGTHSVDGGTIYTISKDARGDWRERVVHDFYSSSSDFAGPASAQSFVYGGSGTFYGCGTGGPYGNGGVFSVSPRASKPDSWTPVILYAFGQQPTDPKMECDLALGIGGVVFGVAPRGGGASVPSGAIFKLTPPGNGVTNWTEQTIFSLGPNSFLGNTPIGAPLHKGNNVFGVSTMSYGNGPGLIFGFHDP